MFRSICTGETEYRSEYSGYAVQEYLYWGDRIS